MTQIKIDPVIVGMLFSMLSFFAGAYTYKSMVIDLYAKQAQDLLQECQEELPIIIKCELKAVPVFPSSK